MDHTMNGGSAVAFFCFSLRIQPFYPFQIVVLVEGEIEGRVSIANLLTSVNSLNKKIIKNLLPGAVEHPATLISRQYNLSAENHRNGSSETINRHQEMAGNAEIQ